MYHRIGIWIATLLLSALMAYGQGTMRQIEGGRVAKDKKDKHDDSDNDRHGTLHARYLHRRTGDRLTAPVDTVRLDFFHRSAVEGRSVAEAYTSTFASPYESKIYFDRPRDRWGDFFFTIPYRHLIHQGADMKFYDAKVPYTYLSYVKGGSSDNVEENFHTLFTTNLGRKLNVGGAFDYDYANGYYASTKSKNITYRLFASYTGDKYELFFSLGNTNVVNFENGGITDDRYITHPEEVTGGRRGLLPKDIPTRFGNVWNRVNYGTARLNHRYSLGITRTDSVPSGDSVLVIEHFTPVTSFFHDLEIERGRRHFVAQDNRLLQGYTPILSRPIDARYYPDDEFTLTRISNSVGIELLEGFHKWAKMGAALFLSLDHKRYEVPLLGLPDDHLNRNETTSYVGGRISKQKGTGLTYYASGEFAFAGAQVGELRADAALALSLNLKGQPVQLNLRGDLLNLPPSYLLYRYKSTLHEWNQQLKMSQTLRLGGTLSLPHWRTQFFADVETVQSPLYVNPKGEPAQHSGNFRVMAVGAKQHLSWRALHLDGTVVWQHSSDATVAPLPMLAAYANLYLKTMIAGVMTLQVGLDAKYHTAYRAPYYDATTQLFRPQEETIVGGVSPLMSGYANAHLKRTRFFVQYYNLSSLLFKPSYFSMPHYPVNPAILRLGVVVDLRN